MKIRLGHKGQSMTEYILIIALVAIAAIAAIKLGLAAKIKNAFTSAGEKIANETQTK